MQVKIRAFIARLLRSLADWIDGPPSIEVTIEFADMPVTPETADYVRKEIQKGIDGMADMFRKAGG